MDRGTERHVWDGQKSRKDEERERARGKDRGGREEENKTGTDA